jgi:Dolichyl-phosphate-mannose-protein mannosyltransferase
MFLSVTETATGRSSTRPSSLYITAAGLVGVLCVAAWLRWQYVVHVQPYPDEFVTLLAIKMILQKGLPVLPSGLFYEHGLLFSYAGALVSSVAGFSREAVRAASLGFGVVTVWLCWRVGRRWFSPSVGLLAAVVLAVTPGAVLWGGRARMYSMLQVWVLLTVGLVLAGVLDGGARWRRLAVLCYLAAALTHFVSVSLLMPLLSGMLLIGWLRSSLLFGLGTRQNRQLPWFRARHVWLELVGWFVVVVVAIVLKRFGQPKSIAPLEATGQGVISGIGQVIAIYGSFSANVVESWRSVAQFFTAPEAVWMSALGLLATGWVIVHLMQRRLEKRDLSTLFMAWVLGGTTLEMILLVAPERRDEKYLFMLLPLLALLAADGLTRLAALLHHVLVRALRAKTGQDRPVWVTPLAVGSACLGILLATWPATAALLERTGADYDTAFGYVQDQWREGDAVLTGTPAAAAIYLGRNDYYAVQDPGYAYRILKKDGQSVDRWIGSPWLATDEQLHTVLSSPRRTWLVLERWGLIQEYYAPLTMQRILAMTDFVREDNGIIILRSRQGAPLIPEAPSRVLSASFDSQILLQGYHINPTAESAQGQRFPGLDIVLYWQAQHKLSQDYTVFVHLRDGAGHTIAQSDHLPLAPILPPTLWPIDQTIRERSVLSLPQGMPYGKYDLWVGLYRLDTLERLPVVGDQSGENAVLLASVVLDSGAGLETLP